MGALRAGIHEILLPEGNVSDLSEIDPQVRSAVHYTAVSHMDQVLDKALEPASKEEENSVLDGVGLPANGSETIRGSLGIGQ